MLTIEHPLQIIRAMAYTSWSDRQVAPGERRLIEATILALGLSGAEHDAARACLQCRPELSEVDAAGLSPEEARYAMVQCLRVALADRDVSAIEEFDLDGIRVALGVSEETLRKLREAIQAIYA